MAMARRTAARSDFLLRLRSRWLVAASLAVSLAATGMFAWQDWRLRQDESLRQAAATAQLVARRLSDRLADFQEIGGESVYYSSEAIYGGRGSIHPEVLAQSLDALKTGKVQTRLHRLDGRWVLVRAEPVGDGVKTGVKTDYFFPTLFESDGGIGLRFTVGGRVIAERGWRPDCVASPAAPVKGQGALSVSVCAAPAGFDPFPVLAGLAGVLAGLAVFAAERLRHRRRLAAETDRLLTWLEKRGRPPLLDLLAPLVEPVRRLLEARGGERPAAGVKNEPEAPVVITEAAEVTAVSWTPDPMTGLSWTPWRPGLAAAVAAAIGDGLTWAPTPSVPDNVIAGIGGRALTAPYPAAAAGACMVLDFRRDLIGIGCRSADGAFVAPPENIVLPEKPGGDVPERVDPWPDYFDRIAGLLPEPVDVAIEAPDWLTAAVSAHGRHINRVGAGDDCFAVFRTDGERLQVFHRDEKRWVCTERLCRLLAAEMAIQHPGARIGLDEGLDNTLARALVSSGLDPDSAAPAALIQEHRFLLSADRFGRFRFLQQMGWPDPLLAMVYVVRAALLEGCARIEDSLEPWPGLIEERSFSLPPKEAAALVAALTGDREAPLNSGERDVSDGGRLLWLYSPILERLHCRLLAPSGDDKAVAACLEKLAREAAADA